MSSLNSLKRKILLSLVFGLVVVLGLAIYADLPKIGEVLASFRWKYLPLILGLTLFNYLLRFVKWHYYLNLIGVRRLSVLDSLLIFFSGLSMVMTPGKVGEWLKSYLLKEAVGTSIAASAPIIVAERLTDGLAMLLLAAAGVLLYGYSWEILFLILLAALALIVLIQYRPLALALLSVGEGMPVISKRVHYLHAFYESSYQLLRVNNLLLAVGIGFVSWTGECVAFYFVLVGLGLEPGSVLVVQAAFVLAVSTLVGSVSMLPGGLAVAEGSITTLLLVLRVVTAPAIAAAATLLIRFFTLWFGVSVGIVALFAYTRRVSLDSGRNEVRPYKCDGA